MNKISYLLICIILTGCGGGNSDTSSTLNNYQGSDVTALEIKKTTDTTSTTDQNKYIPVASENQNFLVSGTMTVRYGSGDSWITKEVTNSGTCSNNYFGKDPLYGIVKSCQVVLSTNPIATTGLPAKEGSTFTIAGTATVRYGANNSWITKDVTNSGTCSNDYFGNDPLNGVVKTCELVNNINVLSTAGLTAKETATFYVFGTANISYGAQGKYINKDVTGRADCTNEFFGNDPLYGIVKSCQLTSMIADMPVVDLTKIPTAAVGFSEARVTAANVADPSQNPAPSDIGDFREYCEFSHMSYADPIAVPGGYSNHLHTFMGNTGTNSNSTADSILKTGNSTCAGGILNRTSYWFPSVIDTKDGTPLKPQGSLIYYKQGYNYIASKDIKQFPEGLRIVAGDSMSKGVQGNTGFTCFKPDGTWTNNNSIPTECPAGSTLTIGVAFPQCWDGVNLDSPDHKSHMAYPGFGCPSTHPVALTGITFNINYKVKEDNETSRWRLSSDNYDKKLPGGYSTHADWFYGWEKNTVTTWTTKCINATMDCHAFLIGDGRILY